MEYNVIGGCNGRMKVLIVEDDPAVTRSLLVQLGGEDVEAVEDPALVLSRIEDGTGEWDVVVLDVGLPGMNGIEVLTRFREAGSFASVVMLTGDSTAATATTCMRAGAFYYLTKPFVSFEFKAIVQSAGQFSKLRRELAGARQKLDESAGSLLVGTSVAMRELRASIARLGGRDVSILIHGESGSGKELVARALHARGPRRDKAFVALNTGAVPETLIDSELFGHVRGSFTGAQTDRAGVFVEANGGTLLLDEIGDMPMPVQVRLLRVLQEGEIRAVGSSTTTKVDVRVLAASHVDLSEAVKQGRFREDLYYRLNVVKLQVPPLRERLDDLPLLTAHMLRKHGGTPPPTLTPEALEVMADHSWPGNVRELENAILHAIALRVGDEIGVESLPAQVHPRTRRAHLGTRIEQFHEAKERVNAALELRYLTDVMTRASGSVSEAARMSGLDRTNFRRLLQRNGIDPNTFKPDGRSAGRS
jgi:DNA-binding NtrC family response regulator